MDKYKKHIMVLIFLSLSLVISLWGYAHIDPKPPYNEYEFWVSTPQDTITIGDFQLFYDFDSQSGKIEFQVRDTDNLERINVDIPSSLNITGYNVTKEERIISDFKAEPTEKGIVFDTLNSSVESATFVINIQKKDEDIYPNGKFAVHVLGNIVYSKFEEGYGGARIKFNLGKYSCDEPCFYDIANTEPPRFLNNSMQFSERKQEQGPVRSTIFVIRTLDKNEMILKEASFAIFIGLLVGIVFLITEWVGKKYSEN